MADYTSFQAVFKNIEKATRQAKIDGAKKAAISTRVVLAKNVKEQIGLASAKTKQRVKLYKADAQGVILSIGVKFDMPAQDFNPKKIQIQSARGPRTGASYQIKGQSRVVVPGAFLATVGSKNVMLKRQGQARYPVETVRIPVFRQTVEAMQPELQQHMSESFERNFRSALNYRLGG